jgi:hypothetical protein
VEKVIQALLKNTPLACVAIGVLLVLIGASGGMERFSLKIEEPAWRVALAVMGIVVAGFGGLLIWRAKNDVDPLAVSAECELRITTPMNGADVEERIQFAGSFKKKPPENSVILIEQSVATGDYWFKKRPIFDEKNKQWYTESRVGGEPGKQRVIYVAILGESGQALWDYYWRVGNETKQWPGMKLLTKDIKLCDSVKVRRK